MKERWLEVSENADEKQEKRLEEWASGKGVPFQNSEAEEKFRERAQMIKDAVQMKKMPKRVPVSPSVGYFPAEVEGLSFHQMMYDLDLLIKAWTKFYDEFDLDTLSGPFPLTGKPFDILDFQMYRWPGHGLPEDREFQFVEKEYMPAEEYRDLIDDPSGWFLTVYFPRIFGCAKGFAKLPVIPNVNELPMVASAVIPFAMPDVQKALKCLMEAGEAAVRWMQGLGPFLASIRGRGYPAMGGGLIKAPFDVLGDSLRGTRGIMLDMFRRPDEVKEACKRLTPLMVKAALAASRGSGNPFIMIPLHKGADGFISEEQFLTFYWPTLRQVLIALINEGLVPIPFAEGSYDSRLEIISDLPKGKCIWMFDRTDMARAKETIGKVACLEGNVPLDLMCTGTPEEVRAYSKQVIETAGRDGGYIFATGASLQGAKAENVRALVDAGKEFGTYSS
jgi:hypothetical protein